VGNRTKERQCKYNIHVPLRRVRTTIVVVDKRVCICGLRYPACNARAPNCHLWSVWLYNTFLYDIICHDFLKKLLVMKCVWLFLQKCLKCYSFY